jgi:hypothetical protein
MTGGPVEAARTFERRAPRSAGLAGIVFSLLFLAAVALAGERPPEGLTAAGLVDWFEQNARTPVTIAALYLLPFAGIAFLWFIGVIRDRIGDHEDRLFATVFLGSGLLFLAMLFASTAIGGSILIAYRAAPNDLLNSSTYSFARAATYLIMYTYASKMAGLFMMSACTVFVRTRVMPRWMAWLGYALALLLLIGVSQYEFVLIVFPLWILLVSVYILIENFGRRRAAAAL